MIKWKSSRGWPLYYATDGMRHGETTTVAHAIVVSRERFEDLVEKRILPESAEFVEVE